MTKPIPGTERRGNEPAVRFLSYADIAALTGLQVATLRKYAMQGHLPPPDARIGRAPGWTAATIEHWRATRPGRGARTDRR
ncbi:MAG: helix-turn-helix transcriptional regulator [Mycobacteriales bacterium]